MFCKASEDTHNLYRTVLLGVFDFTNSFDVLLRKSGSVNKEAEDDALRIITKELVDLLNVEENYKYYNKFYIMTREYIDIDKIIEQEITTVKNM